MHDLNDVWNKPPRKVESPCNRQCYISSVTGVCDTCLMSLKEIVEWETAAVFEKEAILEKVKKRKESKNEISSNV
jgi:predicted Fe-S protein YdhL (DUF1289 family)